MSIRDYISCVCVFILMTFFRNERRKQDIYFLLKLLYPTIHQCICESCATTFLLPNPLWKHAVVHSNYNIYVSSYPHTNYCFLLLTARLAFFGQVIMLRDRSVFVFGALSLSLADSFTVDFSSVTLQQKDVLSSRQTARLDRRGLFNELVCAWKRTHIHFVALRITAQILPCNGQMKRAL